MNPRQLYEVYLESIHNEGLQVTGSGVKLNTIVKSGSILFTICIAPSLSAATGPLGC